MQVDHRQESYQVMAKSWAAFHAKAPWWRTKGSLHAKMRVFPLPVCANSACARGPRHRTGCACFRRCGLNR